MLKRRDFLTQGLCAGITTFTLSRWSPAQEPTRPQYELTRDVPTRLFDGKKCWSHPRAGIVPAAGTGRQPRVVMTMNTLDLSGSDVFKAMHGLHTDDLGQTWTEPKPQEALAVRHETLDGQKRPVAVSDFWPTWHAPTQTLLGTGHTVVYTPDWKVPHPRPRHTAYAVYDAAQGQWQAWRKMPLPEDPKFHNAGAGCTQRYDLEDGTILLPFYFQPPGKNSHVSVARCSWDGKTLTYLEHGQEMAVEDKTRGLHEPSLTRFGGTFFLTLRNDRQGYVTRSRDGLDFEPLRPWQFDDGSDLGNYNTQQHWVTHAGGLFLVYTRRGADNDHVFRHRAPLFMAQVDPDTLRVIRETERILVPERGARLGNFGVTRVSDDETWVTVSEWMQPKGVEKHGSDGSVFVARIRWDRPNRAS
ncbi:MAG: sialidase family protein [Pirellulaceae bacterium]